MSGSNVLRQPIGNINPTNYHDAFKFPLKSPHLSHGPWTEATSFDVFPISTADTGTSFEKTPGALVTNISTLELPKPIWPKDLSIRNGVTVSGPGVKAVAYLTDAILARRMKLLFRKSVRPTEAYDPGAYDTNADTWRFKWHSSPNCQTVDVVMVLIPVNENTTAGTDGNKPRAHWTIDDGVSPVVQQDIFTTNRNTSTIVPDDYFVVYQEWTVTPNTTYTATLNLDDRIRVISATVFERPRLSLSPNTDVCVDTRQFVPKQPIYDLDVADLFDAATQLYKRQGAHLFSWAITAATARTTTSATYINILSASETSWTSSSRGFWVWPAYRSTLDSVNTITGRESHKVVFYAVMSSSSGAQTARVDFIDQNNGTGAPIATLSTTSTTPVFVTSAVTDWSAPSVNNAKIDVGMRITGGATISVYAAGAYLYET